MIKKIIKKITTEEQFQKLRELKYILYCKYKGWTWETESETYIITTKQKKIKASLNTLFLIKFIKTLNELYPDKKNIDLTKKYFKIKINDYQIKTDVLAFEEWNTAINKYNQFTKLKNGDVVLDVGAYHGIYSFLASSQIGPKGKIYAFEPDPNNYKILIENIKFNKIKNVIPIKKALFNKTGTQKFVISCAGSSIYLDKHSLNGDSTINKCIINVPTISFADFIKLNKIKKLDFVKMDCEGSEIEICKEYLERIYPKLKTNFAIASYHYRTDYNSKTAPVIEKLFKNKKKHITITNNKMHLTTYITKKN